MYFFCPRATEKITKTLRMPQMEKVWEPLYQSIREINMNRSMRKTGGYNIKLTLEMNIQGIGN